MKKIVAAILIVALALSISAPARAASARRLPAAYNISTLGNETRDFTAFQAWEDATDNNLVTAARGEVLDCYPDSASYNEAVIVGGATTSLDYFRVIRAAPGYEGQVNLYSTSSNGSTQATLWVLENFFGIYDLNIQKNNTNSLYTGQGIAFVSALYCRVVGCIIGPVYSAGGNWNTEAIGINFWNCPGYVIDTVIKDVTNAGATQYSMCISIAGTTSFASTAYLYNSLIENSRWGVNANTGYGGGYCYAKNTIGRNLTTTTYGSGIYTTTSLLTTGAGSVVFEADGYHLSDSDVYAKDQGADLSADAIFAFSDDIDGGTRPYGEAWDIGPDEFGATAPAPSTGVLPKVKIFCIW